MNSIVVDLYMKNIHQWLACLVCPTTCACDIAQQSFAWWLFQTSKYDNFIIEKKFFAPYQSWGQYVFL